MIYRSEDRKFVEREFARMGFANDSRWRISDINKDFEQCNTYPRFLILPSSFTDEDLETVAKFRYFRRIPTAVWRHVKNGCFIVRSSQPTVGWFGWFRSELDENLVQSYVNNTLPPNSEQNNDNRRDRLGNLGEDDNDLCDDQQTLVDEDEERDCLDEVDSGTTLRCTSDGTNHIDQNQLDQESKENHNNNLNNNYHDTPKNLVSGNGVTVTTTPATSSTPTPMTDTTPMTTTPSTPESRSEPTKDLVKTTINSDTSPIQAKTTPALNINGNGTIASDNNISPGTESSTTNSTQTAAPTLTSKMLIIDARSYAAAMANRAKGGGCECTEYYHRCEVQFMNLANIHSIRKSFHAIRGVCEAYSEQSNNWVSFLDNSRWLHHISGLLKSALLVVDTIDIEEKSILIHCSDGWDRTPQLVALAEIMLDPHYRTFDGFRALIQREWLDFGHKFADRCGSNPCNEDPNERCPVFLQWLDCVQQLLMQYPKQFEFNSSYLDKINRHTYSNVFGTFSYNSTQERILSRVNDRFFSLWSYFDSSRRRFRNEKYVESDEILRPSFKVRDLHFWKEVYLPPIRNQTPYMPFVNNIDNKKFYDSLYIDGLTRTVCK